MTDTDERMSMSGASIRRAVVTALCVAGTAACGTSDDDESATTGCEFGAVVRGEVEGLPAANAPEPYTETDRCTLSNCLVENLAAARVTRAFPDEDGFWLLNYFDPSEEAYEVLNVQYLLAGQRGRERSPLTAHRVRLFVDPNPSGAPPGDPIIDVELAVPQGSVADIDLDRVIVADLTASAEPLIVPEGQRLAVMIEMLNDDQGADTNRMEILSCASAEDGTDDERSWFTTSTEPDYGWDTLAEMDLQHTVIVGAETRPVDVP